jgi:hypothetical protein
VAETAVPEGAPIQQADCASLSTTGRGRFHLDDASGVLQIWSDVSWLCWSAEQQALVQRPCADTPAQRFEVLGSLQGPAPWDVRLKASDGRCVQAPADTGKGQLILGSCSDSALQVVRL